MSNHDVLPYLENAYSFLMDPAIGRAIDEIKRLREANKRLGEIATDAVGWMPPASVNGPREEYQNEIKELTDDQV